MPPAHGAAHYWERTYKGLLGSLDGSKKDVWAECLFVDPVADIAILDCPDEQELDEHADAYHALIDSAPALRIGHVRTGCGWVLTLDGHWVRTTLYVFSGMYRTSLSIGPTKPGMSGSPILNEAGRAVGVVTLGEETVNSTGERQEEERQGPQAILAHNLPGWLLNAAHAVGPIGLGPIAAYCMINKLPILTCLVVEQDSGLPGEGLLKHIPKEDIPAEQHKCFVFNWGDKKKPTVEQLRSAYAAKFGKEQAA